MDLPQGRNRQPDPLQPRRRRLRDPLVIEIAAAALQATFNARGADRGDKLEPVLLR